MASAAVKSDKSGFELTFSEDLGATVDVNQIVVTNADGVRYTVANSPSVNGKVLTIALQGVNPIPNGSYTIKVNAGAVTDALGNANSATSVTVTVGDPSDTTKPTVTIGNKAGAKNVFQVTFSEEVTSGTALNLANYSLDGKSLPSGTDIYFTDATKTVVEIVLPANSINIGDQTNGAPAILRVSGVSDKAGNVIDPTSATVQVYDNTAAVLQSARLLGDTLALTFDEALGSVAVDINTLVNNFVIVGDGTAFNAAPDTSATGQVDGKTIIFTITGGSSNWNAVKQASNLTVETKGGPAATLKDANGYPVKAGVKVSVSR